MLQEISNYLKDLSENNNREWFHQNKMRYENLRSGFKVFIEDLLLEMLEIDNDLIGLQPKKCIFRINRDIRFSKDKTPYKTSFSAGFSNDKINSSGYYFEINKDGRVNIFTGAYSIDAKSINNIRKNIIKHQQEFLSIINSKKLTSQMGKLKGSKLKTYPRGFDKDHPMVDYLKHKSFYYSFNSDVTKLNNYKDLLKELTKKFKSSVEFNQYLKKISTQVV